MATFYLDFPTCKIWVATSHLAPLLMITASHQLIAPLHFLAGENIASEKGIKSNDLQKSRFLASSAKLAPDPDPPSHQVVTGETTTLSPLKKRGNI